jgi:polyisoprenoid-binding protein YceI
MTTQILQIPDYVVGTWMIDAVHSEVSFVVRHLGVSKVRGRFDSFEGRLATAEDPLRSTVRVTIDAASVNTGNGQRDDHVRSADFLDVANHPHLTFESKSVRVNGEEAFQLEGDLTVRGVTRPVTLDLEINGFGEDYQGRKVIGFSATTEINRSDFEVTGGQAGMILSEKVKITLEVEAVKQG